MPNPQLSCTQMFTDEDRARLKLFVKRFISVQTACAALGVGQETLESALDYGSVRPATYARVMASLLSAEATEYPR